MFSGSAVTDRRYLFTNKTRGDEEGGVMTCQHIPLPGRLINRDARSRVPRITTMTM
jgi:hypothetical protein